MTRGAPFDKGPYLSAALLCETLLIEKDGVASAIRIIDRVTRTTVSLSPPNEMVPFDYELTVVVILKAGWAHGSYPLRIVLVNPKGDRCDLFKQTARFDGGADHGINVVGRVSIRCEVEGVYWFEVLLGENAGELLTRIPLRVVYGRAFTPPADGSEPRTKELSPG